MKQTKGKGIKIRRYCRDCFNEDMMGCFDGGYDYLTYYTYEQLGGIIPKNKSYTSIVVLDNEQIANELMEDWEQKSDCSLWNYELLINHPTHH